ncbi:hypothetical protein PoB_001097100 [Plakobranchus ocellatus]|uniref:Uncharacterized protein n=1 Tax=Plakobranchus ocellatus TaxID=259542 RepID=A0AAV3YMG4_9GAST|nr:hypothetical protein PoB_001097100 [Plakobranchus ocellatus]
MATAGGARDNQLLQAEPTEVVPSVYFSLVGPTGLQTAMPDVWLGPLHTPAHPFLSTTQLRRGTVPYTPFMSRSCQR